MEERCTSLMKAAAEGSVAMAERSLECSCTQLDAVGSDGRTALMIAAAHGHRAVCVALAAAGCDLDATDSEGKTAIDLAADDACRDALLGEQAKRQKLLRAICGDPAAGREALAQFASPKGASLAAESPF
ncbi:hypothetical protein AB1Y20_018605 [Prymnesium parvum]|uniref:Uncharacterized protein n=1 Tax=Prymnesium parvum TaxID=97485 RepID=A0AB34JPA9_PRYPA